MSDLVFKTLPLGELSIEIEEVVYSISVEINTHGARFKTKKLFVLEHNGITVEKQRNVYFGEGNWLRLPTIEEAVLEILGGTEEDVEKLSTKYDELIRDSFPELITGNLLTGFAKQEYERLQSPE
jgi:hypothetical protein